MDKLLKTIHELTDIVGPSGRESKVANYLKKNWNEYGSIPIKHNRLILFRSDLWHSYGDGFGSDLNTSMLYKKIIIKNG